MTTNIVNQSSGIVHQLDHLVREPNQQELVGSYLGSLPLHAGAGTAMLRYAPLLQQGFPKAERELERRSSRHQGSQPPTNLTRVFIGSRKSCAQKKRLLQYVRWYLSPNKPVLGCSPTIIYPFVGWFVGIDPYPCTYTVKQCNTALK